jgi:hypothetical protein
LTVYKTSSVTHVVWFENDNPYKHINRDENGSDNTIFTSTFIFFCQMRSRADITQMRLRIRVFSDVGNGTELERTQINIVE